MDKALDAVAETERAAAELAPLPNYAKGLEDGRAEAARYLEAEAQKHDLSASEILYYDPEDEEHEADLHRMDAEDLRRDAYAIRNPAPKQPAPARVDAIDDSLPF
jgi:hypothetical protein